MLVKKFLRNKGLSLIEILMSMAILTIVILGVMELNKNNANSAVNSSSNLDYVQLVGEFLIVIEDQNHCEASLVDFDTTGTPNATGNQVKFRAGLIENGTPIANHIEISIWSADKLQNNARVRERFAAGNTYGNIIIDSIKLHLPDHTTGDFTGNVNTQAEIVMTGRKRIATDNTRDMKPIRKTIHIQTVYDGTDSLIVGCGL